MYSRVPDLRVQLSLVTYLVRTPLISKFHSAHLAVLNLQISVLVVNSCVLYVNSHASPDYLAYTEFPLGSSSAER